jgi:hypothetical protein
MRARVDALPVVNAEPGRLGEALAASIVDVAADGGRRYADGRLERTRAFSDLETVMLPDGTAIKTACAPSGDLEAARRASRASFALAASSYAPTSPVLRAIVPAALTLLRVAAVRNFAKRRIAAIEVKPNKSGAVKVAEFSWAHARVQWASGLTRDGFLRTGDAMAFTVNVMSEVTMRLARQDGRPGAYTPGALFGPDLAIDAGGQYFP